jgi:hypothetical protein
VRNIYVNTFAKYEFVWCNLCCWFGLPEDLDCHVNLMHYGQEDLAVYERMGELNINKSTGNGVMKFTEVTTCDVRNEINVKSNEDGCNSSVTGAALTNSDVADELTSGIANMDVKEKVSDSELYETPASSVCSLKNNVSGGSNTSLYSLADIGEYVSLGSRGMGRGKKI